MHKAKPRKERFIARAQAKGNYESGPFEFGPYTPGLPRRMHLGRGRQPYYSTNKDEYDQAVVGTRYTDIVSTIKKAITKKVATGPQIAADILPYIESGTAFPETYTAELLRAAAHLIHLTQVVEAHKSRVPGADKLAREFFAR